MECTPQTTYIPTDESIPTCPDGLVSTECMVNPTAIVYLGLSANATQKEINDKLILALIYKDQQIANLEERITALE